MAAYEYAALDARGRRQRGLVEGDSPRQVRQALRDRGLTPLELREVAEQAAGSRAGTFSFRNRGTSLSVSELALFTRQLSTLLRSGLPLDEALTAIAQQAEAKSVQRVTLGVRSSVVEGNALAHALSQFPGAFPVLFRATAEAGEQAGKLDDVLDRLADYVEQRQAMRSKLMMAAFYPAILTAVAMLVVIMLMTYVVPKVVEVFSSLHAELPFLTRALIAVSAFLRNDGLFLLAAIAVAVLVFTRAMRNLQFRRRMHRNYLRLPLIGRLVRGSNTARFMRTLGILFGAGVPILEALRIGSQVVSNLPMREAVEGAAVRVREGAPVSRSLAESRLFPPITLHLIASGEASGRLDDMLNRAASNQERELETILSALMAVFEPLLILTMGGVVLIIVLAILVPIFDLNRLVQ